jgi:hypothetical protein
LLSTARGCLRFRGFEVSLLEAVCGLSRPPGVVLTKVRSDFSSTYAADVEDAVGDV